MLIPTTDAEVLRAIEAHLPAIGSRLALEIVTYLEHRTIMGLVNDITSMKMQAQSRAEQG